MIRNRPYARGGCFVIQPGKGGDINHPTDLIEMLFTRVDFIGIVLNLILFWLARR